MMRLEKVVGVSTVLLLALLTAQRSNALSCEIPEHHVERLEFELVSVEVDGVPLTDLGAYDGLRASANVTPVHYSAYEGPPEAASVQFSLEPSQASASHFYWEEYDIAGVQQHYYEGFGGAPTVDSDDRGGAAGSP